MREQRKLAAVMFTDIVGYSTIMSQDEEHALEIIEHSHKTHKSAITKFEGVFIKSIGDTTLASFHSALNAVSCAVSIQQALRDNKDINLRIAIHIGDVVVKGGDVFGDCVTISSKIKTLTEAGNICISEHVYKHIHNIPGIEVKLLGENEITNTKHPVKVYALQYDNFPEKLIAPSSTLLEYSISRILFWQELKRRKVLKVAAMYAAATFGILEAFDILFPNVSIPTLVITSLVITVIIGFITSIYLTWLYDFTDEGFVKTEPIGVVISKNGEPFLTTGPRRWLKVSNLIIVVLALSMAFLIYPRIFAKDKFTEIKNEDGRISIAVMPFKNLSGDTLYDVWQQGFQNLLINTLTESKDLSVRQFNTINSVIGNKDEESYESVTPSFASNLTMKLKTKSFILGNIYTSGNNIRINAQLVNAETEEIYKTYQIDGNTESDIFQLADSLSIRIKNYLEVQVIIDEFGYTENYTMSNQNSAEALRYYLLGMSSFINLNYPTAIDWYAKAIEVDSNFVSAYFYLSMAYSNMGYAKNAIKWFRKAEERKESLPLIEKLELDWFRAFYFETPHEQIKYIKQILEIEDQSVMYWYVLGLAYDRLELYDEVIPPLETALAICNNLEITHHWVYTYTCLAEAYHMTGNHIRENEICNLGLSVLPEHPDIYLRQSICAIQLQNKPKSEEYISKYITSIKGKSKYSEAKINSDLGIIYSQAHQTDSAIKYYQRALQMDPSNPDNMFHLGYCLIDSDINVDKGMDLIDKALMIVPDNYLFLDAKGWGLYKQNKLHEALDVLNSSWQNRPYYKHSIILHLKEVKKKIALKKAA